MVGRNFKTTPSRTLFTLIFKVGFSIYLISFIRIYNLKLVLNRISFLIPEEAPHEVHIFLISVVVEMYYFLTTNCLQQFRRFHLPCSLNLKKLILPGSRSLSNRRQNVFVVSIGGLIVFLSSNLARFDKRDSVISNQDLK